MKSLALPAALILLVLVLGGLYYFLGAPSSPPASAGHSASPSAVNASGAQVTPSPSSDEAAKLQASTAAEEAARSTAGTPEVADVVRIRGSVRPPQGCVDPGPIEVIAFSKALEIGDAFTTLDPEWKRARDAAGMAADRDSAGAESTRTAPDAATLGRDNGNDDESADPSAKAEEPRVLARAAVSADGTFTLAIPRPASRAHVGVIGTYWFTSRTTKVDLRSGDATAVLAPRCGAAVRVVVDVPDSLKERAAEIEGCMLQLTTSATGGRLGPQGASKLARRARIARGSVEFHAVDAGAGYDIFSLPDRLAAIEGNVKGLRPGATTEVHVALHAGGTIQGTIVAPAGTKLDKGSVNAERAGAWFGFGGKSVRYAQPRADGAFELAGVAPGEVQVRVRVNGVVEGEPARVTVADGALVTGVRIELEQGNTVAGTVAWEDGQTAAGVEVAASFDISQAAGMGAFAALKGAEGRATSDETGHFTIAGLGTGPFVISAQALAPADSAALANASATEKHAKMRSVRQAGVKPGGPELSLVLRPPIGIAGRVTDAAGAPLASFRVRAQRKGSGQLGDFGQPKQSRDFADPRGEFLLTDLGEGTWKVRALAEGFCLSAPIEVELPRAPQAPENMSVLVIALERGATLRGLVHDLRGQPVANALVDTATDEPAYMTALKDAEEKLATESDGDGAFVLDGVPAGALRLRAAARGFAHSDELALTLAAGEEKNELVLVLHDGGRITGEVYEDGRPAAGMFVQATEMKSFAVNMTTADGQGRFELDHLDPATYQVVAMPMDTGKDAKAMADNPMAMMSKMKMASANVLDGETVHLVLGAAPEAPVRVHGKVTHAEAPCAGASLIFLVDGAKALTSMKTAIVGADGNYEIVLDAPGDYLVSAQPKGSVGGGNQNLVEFVHTIPPEKEHRFDLEMPLGRVSGRVLDSHGKPLPRVRVSLYTDVSMVGGSMWGGQFNEITSKDDGTFDIQMLRAGTYSIAAGGMDFGGLLSKEAAGGRVTQSGLKLAEGEWMRDVELRLEKPGAIEVEVVDDAGVPVESAAIFARDEHGRLVDRFSGITTDKAGLARYAGLSAGSYSVQARTAAPATGMSAAVTLGTGETKHTRIVVRPGTMLSVKTVGPDGKPVRCTLSVVDESGIEHANVFGMAELSAIWSEGMSGEATKVGPLAPGTYTVRATLDGKTYEKSVKVTGSSKKTVTIDVKKG